MPKFKVIGVLGGIGAVATLHFYQTLLNISQKDYGAVQDSDYPHIIINSLAFRMSSENGLINKYNNLFLQQLYEGIQSLQNAGAQLIVIPCNSAHKYINKLRDYSKIPILSILELVEKEVLLDQAKKICILSSMTCYKDLYGIMLKRLGIDTYENDKDILGSTKALILDVMKGNLHSQNKEIILSKINKMKDKGVDGVILGCTELPVVIKQRNTKIKLYDSSYILAKAALSYATM